MKSHANMRCNVIMNAHFFQALLMHFFSRQDMQSELELRMYINYVWDFAGILFDALRFKCISCNFPFLKYLTEKEIEMKNWNLFKRFWQPFLLGKYLIFALVWCVAPHYLSSKVRLLHTQKSSPSYFVCLDGIIYIICFHLCFSFPVFFCAVHD